MNEIEKNNQIVAQAAGQSLIHDLRQIIEQARVRVAATANYELTMMYWHIGERINREVLGHERADYGKQIVSAVSTQLPPRHVLMQQIQKSLEAAKARFANFIDEDEA